MANAEWDSATTEQRLEMLRADITDISVKHNRLSRDFVDLQRRLSELEDKRPKT
jgi:predicted  nucleic acid-binding Zn-ribbon protein